MEMNPFQLWLRKKLAGMSDAMLLTDFDFSSHHSFKANGSIDSFAAALVAVWKDPTSLNIAEFEHCLDEFLEKNIPPED